MIGRALLSLFLIVWFTDILMAAPLPLEAVKPLVSDSEEPRAVKILREWSDLNESCTAVRCQADLIIYGTGVWSRQQAKRELGYRSSSYVYWKTTGPARYPAVDQLSKKRKGEPREGQSFTIGPTCWLPDHLLLLHEENCFCETSNSSRQDKCSWLFFLDLDEDSYFPLFLPGNPNQKRSDRLIQGCTLKIMRENKTHIWIEGKPKNRKLCKNYNGFQLYLEKVPWRLRAVKQLQSSGRSIVYIFSKEELNPQEWYGPDLADFKDRGHQPIFERYPELEIQRPVAARKPQQAGSLLFEIGFILWKLVL